MTHLKLLCPLTKPRIAGSSNFRAALGSGIVLRVERGGGSGPSEAMAVHTSYYTTGRPVPSHEVLDVHCAVLLATGRVSATGKSNGGLCWHYQHYGGWAHWLAGSRTPFNVVVRSLFLRVVPMTNLARPHCYSSNQHDCEKRSWENTMISILYPMSVVSSRPDDDQSRKPLRFLDALS